MMLTREALWLMVGFAGQIAFTGRFVLQWLYSETQETQRDSDRFLVPEHRRQRIVVRVCDLSPGPVFIAGQAFGSIVYLRNLQLIKKSKDLKE